MQKNEDGIEKFEEQDAIDSYFDCITACSLHGDGLDCVTRCVEVHLKDGL